MRINAYSVGQAFWTAASSMASFNLSAGSLFVISITNRAEKTAGSPFDNKSPLASAASTALMASHTTEAAALTVPEAAVVAVTAVAAVETGEAALKDGGLLADVALVVELPLPHDARTDTKTTRTTRRQVIEKS